MKTDVLDQLCVDRAEKRAVALVTHLTTGIQIPVYLAENNAKTGLDPAIVEAALKALHDDKSRMIESADGDVFIHVHNPPLRLIIVGAVHIAQPLARMAVVAGYAVTLIDPRQAFASPERFDDVAISNDWPDEAMRALDPDGRTAVVTLTHDPKLDDPALEVALRSPAFYIGSLGSNRTHGKRRDRLTELGFDDAAFARIHGPVGLDIGALTPAEIAVSIIAEITQVRRRGQAPAANTTGP
jgi:xanthine dehydrogenase accessory factor